MERSRAVRLLYSRYVRQKLVENLFITTLLQVHKITE